jgi:predicted hydrocarbon binding protein
MNRKDFLRSCACGLCAGATAGLMPAASLSAADSGRTEDWRLPFVQRRYARLLEILSRRMDKSTLSATLHEFGAYCSSLGDEWIKKHRGDFDGFCKSIKQGVSGDTVTYDRERAVVTMASDERAACFCPLNGASTPRVVCDCSLGWQQHTWETFFQKKVTVELRESVLRGGRRCVFEIHVSDVAVDKAQG